MALELVFTQPGNYTIEDDGIPGNNISVIKDGNGVVIFTFAHPADSLTFLAPTPGVHLTVNITDSLGAADVRIGDLANPAASPDSIVMKYLQTTGDVTLVSNGTITEGGSDLGADVVAGTLILSAGSGIGAAANALETQTGQMEAETNTGGMNIGNFGFLLIGGLTDLVDGLNVETSGNLTFTNVGSLLLNEVDLDSVNPAPAESVHGGSLSGNVSLTALGFDADILAFTDVDAITVPHGNLFLTAGRDIAFGTAGTNFDNDVRASGSITVNAGRDFLIDGFSDLVSDDFGLGTGGNLVINAGRNIHLRSVTGTDASILANGNAGADVILTTGFNGALVLDTPSGVGIDPLESNFGDVIVNADRILLAATTSIRADNGQVILRPVTDGREILLGSAGDTAFAVELSDAELDRIFTPNLTIGGVNTGQISVVSALTPAGAPNLTLQSGTDILVQVSVAVTTSLTLRAGDNVFLTPSTINVPTFTAFADQAGNDGNTGGIISLNALVAATVSTLMGNAEADTLIGTSANENMFGLGGNDTLQGNGGNDMLEGGAGADIMIGGLGNDRFYVDNVADKVIEGSGEGTDILLSSVNLVLADSVFVESLATTNNAGTTAINLTGNSLNNIIAGNAGKNVLIGGLGNDTLSGLAGNDTMQGGLGNDTLFGGLGADILSGSNGQDIFRFDTALGAGNVDSITDFAPVDDAIFLDDALFTGLAPGVLAAGAFRTGAAAADADDRIIYNSTTGALFFDADGTGATAAVQFATLPTHPVLTAADFVVI